MLTQLDSHEKILNAMKDMVLPITFFASPYLLNTFFNNTGFELWSGSVEGKTYIFIKKVDREFGNNEVRLLFALFPGTLIEEIKQVFNPPYIAYNELFIDPHKENQIEGDDVVISLSEYINLTNKGVRKNYRQAIKYNHHITVKPFQNIPKEDLEKFWKEWYIQRQGRPFAADRTHNDARFLSEYSDVDYFGIAVYDGQKLIGYSIGIRYTDTLCISAFNKCLRGYRNLGLQISYEKAKQAFEKGFKSMCIGGVNNEFKKQLLHFAQKIVLYGFELERKESFKTKTPNGYTYALFF